MPNFWNTTPPKASEDDKWTRQLKISINWELKKTSVIAYKNAVKERLIQLVIDDRWFPDIVNSVVKIIKIWKFTPHAH